MNRKHHRDGFAVIVGIAMAFCLLGVGISVPGSLAAGELVLAHAGGLSPKDDCHRDKAAGERHWHIEGTSERGGECIKRDGKTVQVMPLEAQLENIRAALRQAEAKVASLEGTVRDTRGNRDEWIAYARGLEAQVAEAIAERDAAVQRSTLAEEDAAEALAQARGAGPLVHIQCRRAVQAVVTAETGWLSDAVKLDSEDRAALADACLSR